MYDTSMANNVIIRIPPMINIGYLIFNLNTHNNAITVPAVALRTNHFDYLGQSSPHLSILTNQTGWLHQHNLRVDALHLRKTPHRHRHLQQT